MTQDYHPEQAACRKNFNFYIDPRGPPFALFNGGGTGAHGQLSEANQRRAVLNARLAIASASPAACAVIRAVTLEGGGNAVPLLDQIPDDIRYPLG